MMILWEWNVRESDNFVWCGWTVTYRSDLRKRTVLLLFTLDSADHRPSIRQMSEAGHWLIRPKLGLTKPRETLLCTKGTPLSPKMNAQDYIAKIFGIAVAPLLHSCKTYLFFHLLFPWSARKIFFYYSYEFM